MSKSQEEEAPKKLKISILGCGWLGLPLAKHLLERGHEVKGSTTTKGKCSLISAEGIEPHFISVTPDGIKGDLSFFLEGADILIINFPPRQQENSALGYLKGIQHLERTIEKSELKQVLLISSTSVYEDGEGFPEYTEEQRPNASSSKAKQLIAAENLLQMNSNFSTVILRFGGLVGPDRHPVTYLAGRTDISNPEAPVNLIHQEDCIGIIQRIVEKEIVKGVFNAVCPIHPRREEYYSRKATERGLQVPQFNSKISRGKIIDSRKVIETLQYEFGRMI